MAPLLLILCLFHWSGNSLADLTNFNDARNARNIAIIHVEENQIRVALEIFLEDMGLFEALIPDTILADGTHRAPLQQRLAHHATQGLSIRQGEQYLLPVLGENDLRTRTPRQTLFNLKVNPQTGTPLRQAPQDSRVIFAELIYPMPAGLPEALTFSPPMDEAGRTSAEIGVAIYDRGVLVSDFRFLGRTTTLHLHATDPWYSSFSDPNIRRDYHASVASYLDVTPWGIRHQSMFRLQEFCAEIRLQATLICNLKHSRSSYKRIFQLPPSSWICNNVYLIRFG